MLLYHWRAARSTYSIGMNESLGLGKLLSDVLVLHLPPTDTTTIPQVHFPQAQCGRIAVFYDGNFMQLYVSTCMMLPADFSALASYLRILEVIDCTVCRQKLLEDAEILRKCLPESALVSSCSTLIGTTFPFCPTLRLDLGEEVTSEYKRHSLLLYDLCLSARKTLFS